MVAIATPPATMKDNLTGNAWFKFNWLKCTNSLEQFNDSEDSENTQYLPEVDDHVFREEELGVEREE